MFLYYQITEDRLRMDFGFLDRLKLAYCILIGGIKFDFGLNWPPRRLSNRIGFITIFDDGCDNEYRRLGIRNCYGNC